MCICLNQRLSSISAGSALVRTNRACCSMQCFNTNKLLLNINFLHEHGWELQQRKYFYGIFSISSFDDNQEVQRQMNMKKIISMSITWPFSVTKNGIWPSLVGSEQWSGIAEHNVCSSWFKFITLYFWALNFKQ